MLIVVMGSGASEGVPGSTTGSSSKELTTRTLTSPNVDSYINTEVSEMRGHLPSWLLQL